MFILYCLVGVGESTHSAHYAENIVVGSVDGNAGGLFSPDGLVAEDELESGIVNARHIAGPAWLVLLRAQGERVNVNARVRRACVMLVRLDCIEVRSFALTETVLPVKLEFGSHDWVLSPAMHVKRCLREHEGTRVRHETLVSHRAEWRARRWVPAIRVGAFLVHVVRLHKGGLAGVARAARAPPRIVRRDRARTRVHEEPADHEFSRARGVRSREGVVGVGESVNAIGIIPWLDSQRFVEGLASLVLFAAVHKSIFLNGKDELLAWMVEVELDFVARRSHRFKSRELKLLDEVFMRVLRHAAALVGVEEHVVNVERGSNKRFGVSAHSGLVASAVVPRSAVEVVDSPQDAVQTIELNVNLHLVVLEGDERKRKTRVTAEPELQWHVKSGLRKCAARRASIAWLPVLQGMLTVENDGSVK